MLGFVGDTPARLCFYTHPPHLHPGASCLGLCSPWTAICHAVSGPCPAAETRETSIDWPPDLMYTSRSLLFGVDILFLKKREEPADREMLSFDNVTELTCASKMFGKTPIVRVESITDTG